MNYIIQGDSTMLDIECAVYRKAVQESIMGHTYTDMSIRDILAKRDVELIKNSIPIGTLNFVSEWLKTYHGIDRMNPIEVPPCLRTEEFLKRNYSIVSFSDIPRKGRYFIKDVSELKSFSFSGDMDWMLSGHVRTGQDETILAPDHLYQVSDIVDIKSEYRVYVVGGKIKAMACYGGNPLIFPDSFLIQKACLVYGMQEDCPKSYTMDVFIDAKNGTGIMEIHPFVSVGLYCLLDGEDLLYAGRTGVDWYLNYNTCPCKTQFLYSWS